MHSQQEPRNTPPLCFATGENADLIWLTRCSEHEKMLQKDSLFWLLLGIFWTTEIRVQTSRNSSSKLKEEEFQQVNLSPLSL